MTMPEANEHSDQLEDSDFSLIYEDEDFDIEEPPIADEIEESAKGKSKVTLQPSQESALLNPTMKRFPKASRLC